MVSLSLRYFSDLSYSKELIELPAICRGISYGNSDIECGMLSLGVNPAPYREPPLSGVERRLILTETRFQLNWMGRPALLLIKGSSLTYYYSPLE